MKPKIVKDDVIHFAKQYDGEPFHALLCDPPYHLTSIVKRFSHTALKDCTQTSQHIRDRADGFARLAGAGFMGQKWDGGDISFRPETWKLFMELLYPGAFGIAFASCRGYHRMAVAIEDAGFIIHPMIGWLYGQGFPKAHQVKGDRTFKDHRYGLQALKPALEPLVVFQKPYDGKPLDCIKQTGAGTLNIGGCRIAGEEVPINKLEKWLRLGQEKRPKYKATKNTLGRWPANLVHDGSEEVIQSFPNTAPATVRTPNKNKLYGRNSLAPSKTEDSTIRGFADNGGSAARFFYAAKSSPREKNAGLEESNGHPTCKPLALGKWLATLLLPPDAYSPRRIFVPFAGSGSEMIGADIAGWEEIIGVEFMVEYTQLAKSRIAYWHTHKGDIK